MWIFIICMVESWIEHSVNALTRLTIDHMSRQALPKDNLTLSTDGVENPLKQWVLMILPEAIWSLSCFPSGIELWVVSSVSLCGYLLFKVCWTEIQHTILRDQGRSISVRILIYQPDGLPISRISNTKQVQNTTKSMPIISYTVCYSV